jgi:ubiquinone/menaquinone biosynthesis C-methylase UbiE
VGIDPSLDAILAAKRVASQLGVEARFLVGDSRFLPFKAGVFDVVYSYSVFQHFAKDDVRSSLAQIADVLKPDGTSVIQMLNKFGLRSLYVQARRGFREGSDFETRYWSPSELTETFSRLIGPTTLSLASFFTQGQKTDRDLFTVRDRFIFDVAELLKAVSHRVRFLVWVGDNVFLTSTRRS